MIRVYYTVYNEEIYIDKFKGYLSLIPPSIRTKILKYKRWEDQCASLFGKLLLIKGLEDFKYRGDLENLVHTEYGRPYIKNLTIDFNISHSGQLVACAFTTIGKIGLDVEECNEIEINEFENCFSEKEWQAITGCENQIEKFYHYWTIKEAVLKGNGKGLSVPLKNVFINNETVEVENTKWYIKKIELEHAYYAHLGCNCNLLNNIIISKITF